MIAGFTLLLYSAWNIWGMKQNEQKSLAEAKELVGAQQSNSEHKDGKTKSTISFDDFHPKKGDVIGVLYLPAIDSELPIIEGTSEDELERGVGHYSDTVFPGEKDQILLSGHRDTVFRKLGDLQTGDQLIVELPYGTFTYEIYETKIVDADDTTVIASTYPNEVLTLSTCYPFGFVGDAPERYIIFANPVN